MTAQSLLGTLHHAIWLDQLERCRLSKNSVELADALKRAEFYINQLLEGGQIQAAQVSQLKAIAHMANTNSFTEQSALTANLSEKS